jgi:hypothetical protein
MDFILNIFIIIMNQFMINYFVSMFAVNYIILYHLFNKYLYFEKIIILFLYQFIFKKAIIV